MKSPAAKRLKSGPVQITFRPVEQIKLARTTHAYYLWVWYSRAKPTVSLSLALSAGSSLTVVSSSRIFPRNNGIFLLLLNFDIISGANAFGSEINIKFTSISDHGYKRMDLKDLPQYMCKMLHLFCHDRCHTVSDKQDFLSDFSKVQVTVTPCFGSHFEFYGSCYAKIIAQDGTRLVTFLRMISTQLRLYMVYGNHHLLSTILPLMDQLYMYYRGYREIAALFLEVICRMHASEH